MAIFIRGQRAAEIFGRMIELNHFFSFGPDSSPIHLEKLRFAPKYTEIAMPLCKM